ncbi:hypothetical protein QBC40DRAFT_163950 [Triangularia verruculosa]|uniref:Uncharacterized protein n=1 Tax=Triangularia verruculosa TaxID=2587418 RepID=A0AAN6XSM7_9PEZI|nr:hypothetical protein QBC40DRAFT_163950 [Triangularia verruculosa]
MRPLLTSSSATSCLLAALFSFRPLVEAAQCYGINGQKTSGTQCNSKASGIGSSHSSCCDESRQEACLSSGLCFATQRGDNHTFWSQGCTDPTGMDPACPSYCGRSSQYISMPIQPSYTMLHCGSGAWCCCYDNLGMVCDKTECCSRNFTLSRGLGIVTRQFNNAGGSNNLVENTGASLQNPADDSMPGLPANMPPWMRLVPVIAAGLLASLLLASIVALGFSCTQNRRLRRQVESLQNLNTTLTTEKLRSFSLSQSSPSSSARPSVSAPSVPPPLITTTAAGNDNLPILDSKSPDDDYLPPISVRSPLTAITPSGSGPEAASLSTIERKPSSTWVSDNGYTNEEPIRTPRTPITAAYHHHLSMVNQALGPSSSRSGYAMGGRSDHQPPIHLQQQYQQQQQTQWPGPPGYSIPMPSPIRPAVPEERRPSWPMREGQAERYTTYTQSGYFADNPRLDSNTPPDYQYEVGGNMISELPGSGEKGRR